MMVSKATHPGTRTVTTSSQFRRTTGKDLSAHKSFSKRPQNGFPTTAFAICLVTGTDLKNIRGLVFLFKVHPDLPRPMRLRSDIRNNSRRKEAYK